MPLGPPSQQDPFAALGDVPGSGSIEDLLHLLAPQWFPTQGEPAEAGPGTQTLEASQAAVRRVQQLAEQAMSQVLKAPSKPPSVSASELFWIFETQFAPVVPVIATWTFRGMDDMAVAKPGYLVMAILLAASRQVRQDVRRYAEELLNFCIRTSYVGATCLDFASEVVLDVLVNAVHGHFAGMSSRRSELWSTVQEAWPGGAYVARRPEWRRSPEIAEDMPLRERWMAWHTRERTNRAAMFLGIMDSQQAVWRSAPVELQALLSSAREPAPSRIWRARSAEDFEWQMLLQHRQSPASSSPPTIGELASKVFAGAHADIGTLEPFTLFAILESLHAAWYSEKRGVLRLEGRLSVSSAGCLPTDYWLPALGNDDTDPADLYSRLRQKTRRLLCHWLRQWCLDPPAQDVFGAYQRWHTINLELQVDSAELVAWAGSDVQEPPESCWSGAKDELGRTAFHAAATLALFLNQPRSQLTTPHGVHGALLSMMVLTAIASLRDAPQGGADELFLVTDMQASLASAEALESPPLGLLRGLPRDGWMMVLRSLFETLRALPLDWCLADDWLARIEARVGALAAPSTKAP